MALLIAGLVLLIGGHAFAAARDARGNVISRIGEGPYKVLFAIVAAAGLVLIVMGYGQYRSNGYIAVWSPPAWTRHITLTLMWFSFVSLTAAYVGRGRIAGWLRHPMLTGVKIWALAHLLVRGDLGSIILFGALLLYAGLDRMWVKRRGDKGAPRIDHFNAADARALVIGTLAYLIFAFYLHRVLIGVSPVG